MTHYKFNKMGGVLVECVGFSVTMPIMLVVMAFVLPVLLLNYVFTGMSLLLFGEEYHNFIADHGLRASDYIVDITSKIHDALTSAFSL